MKLYEIPAEFAPLEQALIDNDGELTPELEQSLDTFLRSGKEKIEGAAMVIRSLDMEAEACRAEAERLCDRATSIEKNAERLRKLVLYAVDGAFGGKVRTALFTIWSQTSAPVVNFELPPGADIHAVPLEYLRIKDPELDKQALRAALEAEIGLPEQIIVGEHPGTRYLRIK